MKDIQRGIVGGNTSQPTKPT
ncbi:unnamed protein product, partial [Rotaria socialis]